MTAKQAAYEAALAQLKALAALKDWSAQGDRDFHKASEDCYWAKCALVREEAALGL